jgi:hypothetical protein
MKSLTSVSSALALCFVLTSVAAAQPQTSSQAAQAGAFDPYAEPARAPASASQVAPVPVAEAKKRYHATQEHLQRLLKGQPLESLEVEVRRHENDAEIAFHRPRDRLRSAVAEDFDARRQLQQSELAELEARIERIKRALQIRDAMRETLIDQRTDELLDEMEEVGKAGNRAGPAAASGGRPAARGANDAAAARPAESDTDAAKEEAKTLKLDIDQAKAILDSAERSYERVQRLHASGAVSQEGLNNAGTRRLRARMLLDRAVVKMDEFLEAHPDLPATNEPSAGEGATSDQPTQQRLTQLDLKEAVVVAEANLTASKNLYDYSKKMHAKGYLTQRDVESKASQMEQARFQLERANLKLDAFLKAHPDLPAEKEPSSSDGAVNEPIKTSDQAAIVGAPADDGASVDDHAMLAALESDVEEAKAKRESAEREYIRFEKMRASGAIEQAVLDEKTEQCKRTQIQLERQELKRDAFLQTHRAEATDKPPADGDAAQIDINRRLAALGVQEAEANLAEQEIRYERFKRHVADKAIQPRLLEEQAEKYKHAQIQLERAKANLRALDQPQVGDRAADEQTKTSSDRPAIEQLPGDDSVADKVKAPN